jgi:hypothetical protein
MTERKPKVKICVGDNFFGSERSKIKLIIIKNMKKDKKTIGIIIRFFTDGLPDRVGQEKGRIPFWTCGNVHLESNPAKGVKAQNEMFYYIDDIPRAIREIMKKSKLVAVEDVAYSIRAQKREKRK